MAHSLRAHNEKEAPRLLEEGQAEAGLDAATLARLPGSDRRKIALATRIWQSRTVGMSWLSERLQLRKASNAKQQIRRFRQAQPRRCQELLLTI